MTAVKTDDGTQRRATEILPGLSSRTRQNGPFVVRGQRNARRVIRLWQLVCLE